MKLLYPLLIAAMVFSHAMPSVICAASAARAVEESRRSPTLQTSAWGATKHGLQCRVIVPVTVEQGEQVRAVVEFRSDPAALEPNVRRLNMFLPVAFLSLSMTNLDSGERFWVEPYDPTGGSLALDFGQTTMPLDGTPVPSIQVNFPLLKLYGSISPGNYACEVRFCFPADRTRWWNGDGADWKNAGFWNGMVASGKFLLNIRRETPKTKTFLLPKRLRLVKELRTVREEKDAPIVPIPTIRFKAADAEEFTVPLRNGHFLGTRCDSNGGMSLFGGPPKPDDLNSVGAWYGYQSGDKKVDYTIELYETADPPMHLSFPGPGSGDYRVLWKKTFSVTLSERSFRKMAAVALDLSKSRMTDAGLSILKEHRLLERLSLANTAITDAGLVQLIGLKRLEILYLYDTPITDAGLRHLKHLPSLKSLNLVGTKVTDAGVAYLRDLSRLESLDLARTQVTDAALENLRGLKNLRVLSLYKTQVGDAGLVHLRGLTRLETLLLSDTQVTDAGLEHLTFLRNLQTLRSDHTKVSTKGVNDLQRSLPHLEIER